MAKLNGAERIRLVALAFKGTPKGELARYFDLNKGQVEAILQKVAKQGLFTCCKRWHEADMATRGVPIFRWILDFRLNTVMTKNKFSWLFYRVTGMT